MIIDRSVLHIDLDTFFISCEKLINSSLAGKPVIVGGTKDRGVVASCSYEARYFGVRSGMPMKHALRLCPDAVLVKGDFDLYTRKSREVTEIIGESAPAYEKASIDEFYLDTTGMDRFFGTYQWACELTDKIQQETGLPLSSGLSVNKTVAKMATNSVKPEGHTNVKAPEVKPFLFPQAISKIPQLGPATYKILSRVGIRKIKTLAEMPIEPIERLLGKNGLTLHRKANGIDATPIVPYSEKKSISTERSFEKDTMDIQGLKALLVSMVEKLCFDLRKKRRVSACVTVKLRYSNFDTHTQQVRMAYTAQDHIIIEKVLELFDRLYERRMRLRLLGVKLSSLIPGHNQIDLFEDSESIVSLYQAMDRMRHRYGNGAVQRASSIGATHRHNAA